jgi:hypothetical protein
MIVEIVEEEESTRAGKMWKGPERLKSTSFHKSSLLQINSGSPPHKAHSGVSRPTRSAFGERDLTHLIYSVCTGCRGIPSRSCCAVRASLAVLAVILGLLHTPAPPAKETFRIC